MLPAQVEYWKLLEQKRHNLATEDYSIASLGEVVRHDYATEQLTSQELVEKVRSNLANEGIGWMNAETNRLSQKENVRHNVASEGLTRTQLGEQQRHNIQSENISAYEASTGRMQAETAADKVQKDYLIGTQNADVNERNASVNEAKQSLAEEQFNFDRTIGISREFRGWLETGTTVASDTRDALINEPARNFAEVVRGIGEIVPF